MVLRRFQVGQTRSQPTTMDITEVHNIRRSLLLLGYEMLLANLPRLWRCVVKSICSDYSCHHFRSCVLSVSTLSYLVARSLLFKPCSRALDDSLASRHGTVEKGIP